MASRVTGCLACICGSVLLYMAWLNIAGSFEGEGWSVLRLAGQGLVLLFGGLLIALVGLYLLIKGGD